MERFRPTPEKKEVSLPFFVVYCETEDKVLYESAGKNEMIEGIVAQQTATEHADMLNHRVFILKKQHNH